MRFTIFTVLALATICILPAFGEYPANYWLAEARLLSLDGSYEKAVASYDKALELDSSNATLLIGKGLALANLGRYSEAIDNFDLALISNSSNADIWYFKGLVLREQGKYQDALSCFNKALEFDPDYEAAQENKELIQQDLNRNNFYELDDILYRAKQREGSLMH